MFTSASQLMASPLGVVAPLPDQRGMVSRHRTSQCAIHGDAQAKTTVPYPKSVAGGTRQADEIYRRHTDPEIRACFFAHQKVDQALAVIDGAYTRHEGIHNALLNYVMDLSEIDQLPAITMSRVVEFLGTLVVGSNPDRFEQASFSVARLSEREVSQFVENLLHLRQHLKSMQRALSEQRRGECHHVENRRV